MEGDHYLLRFGRRKVGDVIERMSKGLEARGRIAYDPALSGLPAAARLVHFLALAKELSRLHDLDNDVETITVPRIRVTVRLVMLVVLVVALILGAFEAGRRWEREHAPRVTYTVVKPFRLTSPRSTPPLPIPSDPPGPK